MNFLSSFALYLYICIYNIYTMFIHIRGGLQDALFGRISHVDSDPVFKGMILACVLNCVAI